ncbi:Hypothetical predicted protein [Olea europaea subsp. europaea]|uniref:Uncharacterized protein n=1 Tax=Olea europaea subsp. europaea TaxID=158383 RepID=A0A8S0RQP5_OLEEU|nr:Hypothetical predicted protein [Olea europaea subsp. europaea]
MVWATNTLDSDNRPLLAIFMFHKKCEDIFGFPQIVKRCCLIVIYICNTKCCA